MVKELRETTGAGMMDAKKALTETDGDFEAAIDWLRTKGLAKAAKKSSRVAAEGLVAVAVKDGKGVAVEVNSETDFVAKNSDFQEMVGAIASAALGVGSRRAAAIPGGECTHPHFVHGRGHAPAFGRFAHVSPSPLVARQSEFCGSRPSLSLGRCAMCGVRDCIL